MFGFKERCAVAVLVLATCGCTLQTTDGERDGGKPPGAGGTSVDGSGGGGGMTTGTGGRTATANDVDGEAPGAGGTPPAAGGSVANSFDASPDDGSAAGAPVDACGATEAHPNDTRETATPFTLGTSIDACLQNYGDNDFYEFTLPKTPAQGGVVAVSITDVSAGGAVEVAVQTAADNGTLTGAVGYHGDAGQNVNFWLSGAAGATFRIDVHYYLSASQTGYTLAMKYTGVPDEHEPNDTRNTATGISVGQAVTGYFFSGFESATEKVPWDDWFKVTLPAGMAHLALTDLPENVQGNVELQDGNGQHLTSGKSVGDGASVTVSSTVAAGDYFVRVTPADYGLMGSGPTIPTYATHPYTLTATTE